MADQSADIFQTDPGVLLDNEQAVVHNVRDAQPGFELCENCQDSCRTPAHLSTAFRGVGESDAAITAVPPAFLAEDEGRWHS